jgi:hypothetical protein
VPHVRLDVRGPKMKCFECFSVVEISNAAGFARLFNPKSLFRR